MVGISNSDFMYSADGARDDQCRDTTTTRILFGFFFSFKCFNSASTKIKVCIKVTKEITKRILAMVSRRLHHAKLVDSRFLRHLDSKFHYHGLRIPDTECYL
jgi:hypothetical protein